MRTDKFNYQAGMSLVEVMVAVFILGTGLLGLGALQARSLTYAQTSFYRSIAADLAADLADRIRANRPPFFALDDATPPVRPAVDTGLATVPNLSTCVQSSNPAVGVAGCPSVFNVENDMSTWDSALRAQLPKGATWTLNNAQKVVAPHQDSTEILDINVMGWRYTLTITWLDDRSGNTASYVTVIQ